MKVRFQLTATDVKQALAEYVGSVRKVNAGAADVTVTVDAGVISATVDVEDRR